MQADFNFDFPLNEAQDYGAYDHILRFIFRSGNDWFYAEAPYNVYEYGTTTPFSDYEATVRLAKRSIDTNPYAGIAFSLYSDKFTVKFDKQYIYDVDGNIVDGPYGYTNNFPANPGWAIYDNYYLPEANPLIMDVVDSEYCFYCLTKDGTDFSHIQGWTGIGNDNSDIWQTPNINLVQMLDVYFNSEKYDPNPPYDYGDTSIPGGGQGGSFDNSSDIIGIPSLPSGGAAAVGMVSMFAPTAAQLASFGTFLWTTLFDAGFDSLLTSLKKWVNDPIESIIQLAAYPLTIPSGSAQIIKFCGIASDLVGAGVSMNKCSSQFMQFDFGSISTPAYWKQALDYSPYTQVSLFLPYIGIVPLKSDDVIDANLHLVYNIDLLTGGFSAFLEVKKNIAGTSLSSVLYDWSGNIATQIPITGANFSQVFGSMMTAVAAIGVGAVTGGLGAAAGGAAAEGGAAAVAGGAISGAGHGLAANVGNVINSKPHVTKSGRLDGTVGALSGFTPYLIIERPVQSLSSKFQTEQGYPSNTVQKLGNLSGMTVCEAPVMSGFSGATEEEKNTIRAMLCEGVIL